jgi:cobalamin synthase
VVAAGVFVLAELIALGSLADREYHEVRTGFILIAIAVGAVLVLASVAPPYRDSANRRGLFEQYNFDNPDRARALIVAALLTPVVILSLSSLVFSD